MITIDTVGKIKPDYVLYAYCGCGHHSTVDIDKVVEKHGADFPLKDIENVLLCKCGRRPYLVQIIANTHVKPW